MIVIVFGLPGSGKTYFATRLARKMGAAYAGSDAVRMRFLKHRSYSEMEKRLIYNNLLVQVAAAVKEKKDLVVDGTFYNEAIRNIFIDEIEGKAMYKLIEVTAPEAFIKERLSRRRANSDADYSVYLKIRDQWQPCLKEHMSVESTLPIEEMLQRAMYYLLGDYDKVRD
ncbi:MAG TPA: AAA family ATPase [Cyclobacteriaceae bacterium]|nr:AAA family ATPase [Cyclobacteriaceae bacterium]